MTTLGILAVLFVLILSPAWLVRCWHKSYSNSSQWRAYDERHCKALLGTPSDPRIKVVEAHVKLAASSGNCEHAAARFDEAAALYHEVADDCRQPNVASMWRRGADHFKSQARAIREHGKASS